MFPISKGLTGLLNAIQLEVPPLFASALQSMHIHDGWTARCWALEDTAAVIPLLHIWNFQYAHRSPETPMLQAHDFTRLYTNIRNEDMRLKLLSMICRVFSLPDHVHLGHTAIKIRETKHAQWLKAHEVPTDYRAKNRTGDGGAFIIFDLRMIEIRVTYLLDNLFVMFGGELSRQAIGAPMGSNCSGGLVNVYLSAHELSFVQQLSDIYTSPSPPPELKVLTLIIQKAFLLTRRFLDDLLSIHKPYLDSLLYTNQTLQNTSISVTVQRYSRR